MSTVLEIINAQRSGATVQAPYTSTGEDVLLPSNDGNVILYIENTGGSALAATVVTTAEVSGQALADTEIDVGAGSAVWAGPFPPVLFNQDDDSVLIQPDAGLRFRAVGI